MLISSTKSYNKSNLTQNNKTSFKRLEKIYVTGRCSEKMEELIQKFTNSKIIQDFCKKNKVKVNFSSNSYDLLNPIRDRFECLCQVSYKQVPKYDNIWGEMISVFTSTKNIYCIGKSNKSKDEAEKIACDVKFSEFEKNIQLIEEDSQKKLKEKADKIERKKANKIENAKFINEIMQKINGNI